MKRESLSAKIGESQEVLYFLECSWRRVTFQVDYEIRLQVEDQVEDYLWWKVKVTK